MSNKQVPFQKNKLVLAMGLAILGSAMTGCSSDDDTDTDTTASVTIKANGGLGGNASFARGGDGGELYIYNNGTTGGVELDKNGKASTSFTSPDLPNNVNLGTYPLEITTDTTLSSVTPVAYSRVADVTGALTIGQLYIDSNDVLRTAAATGVANYATDTIVADDSFYRSNTVPNELFKAVGDDATADLAAAGQLYIRNNLLYIADADNATPDVYYTGLSVAENSTLTVADNSGCDAFLAFTNDIDNNGTIATETNNCSFELSTWGSYFNNGTTTATGSDTAQNGGRLYLTANQGLINSGVIDTSGYTSPDGNGGDGGEIYVGASGYFVNSGELLSKGGDGLNAGGNGGYIGRSSTPTYTENSGIVNTNGGNSTGIDTDQGAGGNAGYIYLAADSVLHVKSSSTITANGGDGTSGGGGGNLYFDTFTDDGPFINAADLSANGGQGSTSNGGYGGYISLESDGGDLLSSGTLSVIGGDSLSTSNNGGSGGNIYIENDYDDSDIGTGDITISGNMDVSGGNANDTGSGFGGNAGDISFYNYTDNRNTKTNQKISLLGYDKIETNGGDGAEGGNAYNSCCSGNVYIYADSTSNDDNNTYAGPIVNNVPIEAKGGNTVTTGTSYGNGGDGGEIYFDTNTFDGTNTDTVTVTNTATINVSGGMGYDGTNQGIGGGWGGDIYLYAMGDVSNSGRLTSNAGDGGTNGRSGGDVRLISSRYTASNTAALEAKGAEGTTDGGNGGYIRIYGEEVKNSGSLNVNAGNATDATSSVGGNGGDIVLYTNNRAVGLTNSGSFSYKAGSGETNGTEGCAVANFVSQGTCELGLKPRK